MALKGERDVRLDDITMTCDVVASQGVGLCVKTAGSGVGLGDSRSVATLKANPSGFKFSGCLMTEVVNIDTTRFHINYLKDQVQINNPVRQCRFGKLTTDQVSGTPTAKDAAYLTTNGQFTPTVSATGGLVATPKVGKFDTAKDADGFATIIFDEPAN